MAKPGDIVLIDFPFTNLAAGKLRPALVVADAFDSDFVFARITSQPKSDRTDVFVSEWEAIGLRLPSWIQLSKLVTIEGSKVHRVVSALSAKDATTVGRVLTAFVAENWPDPNAEPTGDEVRPLDSPE